MSIQLRKTIQTELASRGLYRGEIDGIFGDGSEAAIAQALGLHSAVTLAWDGRINMRIVAELIHHEAIVREAYKDNKGIWTWGIGVTNASGHLVYPRYKDNPQTIRRCLEIYLWLLRNTYAPAVMKAFQGHALSEAQFAAALSFHYNTGAILNTEWVGLVKSGQTLSARKFLEGHYLNGGDLTDRRKAEAALFFDGRWTNSFMVTVWPVRKPSYTPDWSKPQRIDIREELAAALEGGKV